ncbi:MAG TPA: hydrogenase maturation nickel metallochaperone HypA [Methylophilaceae bacterium]|nr:hydrogenase maturation nickel metallochaperone HypA [Methylophilaceae bacterium]HQR59951.1 hydrogenase maturation nickel metallochaperone HypA [Methylophilaceae bacterium]
MHEMSLAEEVLRIIEDAASDQGFRRVRTVILEIGKLAAVEPEAMRFCFDAVVSGTLAEGAALEIEETAGEGWCAQCMATVAMHEELGACPRCGGYRVQVTGGTGMRVKELEVEQE